MYISWCCIFKSLRNAVSFAGNAQIPHDNQDRFHFHREVIPLQALIAIEAGIAVCNTIILLRRSCQHMLQWFLERQAGNGAAVLVPKLMPNRWPPFFVCLSLTIDTKGSMRWLSTLGEDGFVGCGVCWLNAFWELRKQGARWFTAIGTYFSCSLDCSSMYM